MRQDVFPISRNLARNYYVIFFCQIGSCAFYAALKVSKFQKQIFLFSFEPKTQRNYLLISALASKKKLDQKKKALYITN